MKRSRPTLSNRLRVLLASTLACLVFPPDPALSQQVTSGVFLQTYTFSDVTAEAADKVQLLTVPFSAAWSGRSVAFAVNGAWARGIATGRTGGFSQVEGPVDVHVAAALRVGTFTATAIVSLPAGQSTFADDDFLILGLISSDLLPFAVRDWGSGGGGGGSLSYAPRLGATQLRFTGGYLLPQEFRPLEGIDGGFSPGSQARFSAEAIIPSGIAGIIEIQAVHQRTAVDQFEGVDLFSSRNRSELYLSYARPLGARESILVHGSATRRSAAIGLGPAIIQSEADPRLLSVGQRFPGVSNSPRRDLVVVGASMHVDRDRFTALPTVQYRMLRVPRGIGDGWLASVGLGLDYRVAGGKQGRRWIVAPEVRLEKGSFVGTDRAHAVTGWSGGVTVRWAG